MCDDDNLSAPAASVICDRDGERRKLSRPGGGGAAAAAAAAGGRRGRRNLGAFFGQVLSEDRVAGCVSL